MELKTYLPSAKQIDEMSRFDFLTWVEEARRELLRRAEQRDPLTQLRKRISKIVADESLVEVQKEARVFDELENFKKTSQ
ncbi:hypothetical protein M5X06_03915 [Paenibacillus alvei]|uniref:Uncharacterized protein n=1 Tax=Paenibacillus alvei TaxID=44250 RepID=A0ABT4H775_PAEAL|nr:hypothetical protein [Paenibacillus alvei]MCY9764837.1 hypothetical protein [Paenibacillus alvei]MCY9765985.1 hypothetical protein [Paenibacillus alvei]